MVLIPSVVAFVPVCQRVWFTRLSQLKSRVAATSGYSADHAGLEVEKYRAGHVLAAQGLVVKYVDAVEVRIVDAAVLSAAADAVLVAHNLPKLGCHLVTARPVEEMAWRQEARWRKKNGVRGGMRAETLPHQMIINSVAVHKDIYMCAVASKSSRRCTFGELESMAVATRRRRRRL